MSKLRFSVTKVAEVNSSDGFIPYKINSTTFADSWFGWDPINKEFFSLDPGSYYGLYLNLDQSRYIIGDVLNNITLESSINAVQFTGAGITSAGVPVPTGNYLNLTINGSSYKLQILV